MKVYRIERGKYLKDSLKGFGAALTEGFRWNSLNTRWVYAAESRALAVLEIGVHLDLLEDLPTDRHIVEIHVPDDTRILEISEKDLPKNWFAKPPKRATQKIGDEFVLLAKAPVLRVPSSIIPMEFNFLIIPFHPESTRIKVEQHSPFAFDPRWKKR